MISTMQDLPHPLTVQDKWVLLSFSLQQRLTHLQRCVPWEQAGPVLQEHAATLRTAALNIFGQPDPAGNGLIPEAVNI